MNEWQLQSHLTQQWTKSPLIYNDRKFHLIAWELMFPSWGINRNTGKWNEVSVDFILFDGEQTFLCLELKNEIKSRKLLLSAYCQASHRAGLFSEQYDAGKVKRAHENCFSVLDSRSSRNIDVSSPTFLFPKTPQVIPVLAAKKFPDTAEIFIDQWNSMSFENMVMDIEKYSPSKEMNRFVDWKGKRTMIEMLEV